MAVGNTFGATALTSYGGFWIALAITFTPGGFEIGEELIKADNGSMGMFYDSLGLFLMVNLTHLSPPNSTRLTHDCDDRDGSSSLF
jgi:succinate-acetate transporter protein